MKVRYSGWDGTQEPFELSPDEVMDELSNDLFNENSLQRAMQRMMQRGMQNRQGQKSPGIREMLERLRNRRQEQFQKYDMGSLMDGIKERLKDIVDTERGGIDKRLQDARQQAAQEPNQGAPLQTLQKLADKRREDLDKLPEDPAGQIKSLSDYDFMDPRARQKFQELLDQLKQQMMGQYSKQMQESMKNMTPEQMQQLKDMLRDLNQLMKDHAQGKPTDQQFKDFMQQHGSMFGPNPPQNMEELMGQLQERMAQAQSMLNSMSPGDRAQLQQMMEGMMDGELREQLGELSALMDGLMPPDDLARQYQFSGEDPVSMQDAMRLMEQLQQMDQLEAQLRGVRSPEDLKQIDEQRLAELLGEDARRSWEELKKILQRLEDAGYVRRKGDRLELTPKGIRKIGQKAVRDIFAKLNKDRLGTHLLHQRGSGGDANGDTKPWEFGDDFSVDLQKSLMNAIRREGANTPVHLKTDDFEVERFDHSTQAATCLLIDRSRSMGYYGNFTAAKKVAVAMHALIKSQFPRDALYIIGFSDVAHEFSDKDLPELSWDTGISGTNMHHAFMLSRKLLSRHKGSTRQIVMITDGEPTAHLEQGIPYFNYPPTRRTISETLKEARRCTQEGITINTFMLENSYQLVDFINMLTRINRGRAFYASPDKLGEYVLVDYLNNRRRRVA